MAEKVVVQEAAFLHQKDPQLQISGPVDIAVANATHRGEHVPNTPANRIGVYLGELGTRHSLFAPEPDDSAKASKQDLVRQRIIDTFVIDEDAVPEGYFEGQRRIARERGHGDVEIGPDQRHQMVESIQVDQRASLGRWVDYLRSEDAMYPTWFKYYAFKAVTGMAGYDKEKMQFGKRSQGTVAQFPDLNREALAYVYDSLQSKINGEKIEDTEIKKLLDGGNFRKLYGHAIEKVTPASVEQKNILTGSWHMFEQNGDSKLLAKSLQGHGTGWCTAGEKTAEEQLEKGDFYVWYSTDEEGQDTVPRLAIRMENGSVAEVRGIDASQEIEPALIDTAMEQVQKLPGGEAYHKKAEDMKRLTQLDNMLRDDPTKKLKDSDLRFLYEIDGTIKGFAEGSQGDPRVRAIIRSRDIKSDIEQIHDWLGELDEQAISELPSPASANEFLAVYPGMKQSFEIAEKLKDNPDADLELDDLLFIHYLKSGYTTYRGMLSTHDEARKLVAGRSRFKDYSAIAEGLNAKPADQITVHEKHFQSVQQELIQIGSLYDKVKDDPAITLSREELRLLYEFDKDSPSVTPKLYGGNSLLAEARSLRYGLQQEDVATIYGCRPDQVVYQHQLKEDSVVLFGFVGEYAVGQLPPSVKAVVGDFEARGYTYPIENLEEIIGRASFLNSGLTSLGNIKRIRGNLFIDGSSIVSLGELEEVIGDISMLDSQLKSTGKLRHVSGSVRTRGSDIDLSRVQIDDDVNDF